MRHIASRAATSLCALVLATACASGGARNVGQRTNVERPMVTTEDIERNAGKPVEEILQAKVPGLIVSRTPDGGVAIQVRGVSSFKSSNQPLYVIDDIPISPGPGGALAGVNPYDIATIKVLKDPADIAIYGMRGANGVIVITTKKPGKGAN
jgi:TonB-dependent SusC/RagA subfamily outer membrane receptor